MKKQVKLTESELFDVIRESVKNLVMEFGEKNPKVRDYRAKKSAEDLKKGDPRTYETSVKSMGDCGADKETMADFQNKFEKHGVKEATDFDKRNWYGSEGYYNYDDTADSPVEEYNDIELQHIYGRPSYDEDFDDSLNSQPANNLATEGKKAFKVNESQLNAIIKESVNILLEKFGNSQVGQYQLGRLAARKKEQGDEEGYKNVVNNAKLQWGAEKGVGTNQNAFGNGMHVSKNNVKYGYDLAKKGKL